MDRKIGQAIKYLLPPLAVCILACLLPSCQDTPTRDIHPAFYHWKTHFQPGPVEQEALRHHQAHRIYTKYFDVDWSDAEKRPTPQAKVEWRQPPPLGQDIVPVVFITNRSFENIDPPYADTLATQVAKLITRLHPQPSVPPSEVQIDCDWTRRTRDTYFRFLRHLQTQFDTTKTKLSATIRLHQIKYQDRSGIPPVHRGMAMLYNTGDLDNPAEENSILQLQDLRDYLDQSRPYPLPLDAALPIFRWGVLYRQGRLIKLINQLDFAEVEANPNFQKTAPYQAKVLENQYFRGHYLYPGDEIRCEEVQASQLIDCARYAAQTLNPSPRYIALYHLDASCIKTYDPETLAAAFDAFRHPRPRR